MTDAQLDPTDLLAFSAAERQDRRDHITAFIRDTVDAAGADGAVIGLSGGIDSTLTATLAADAIGAENVHALALPGTVSSPESTTDAETVAMDLGIPIDVIEIGETVDTIVDDYPEAADDMEAVGNVRARVRAVYNYLVANHESRIVLGTGNRTEALVGYFTKYGDQAVDCNPIGNLYKCQVRQLARHLGVPEDIVEKTPSAELWAGQTDEEELGLAYDAIDGILALHVDGPAPREATAAVLDVPVEAVDRVDDLVNASTHKRAMPPTPD
ncbi:MAG: NAD+ synthase [Halobacteriaceae archaeon]